MKKILFITHEASRTGAPFVVYYFIEWLKKNHPSIETSVLALKGGDLASDFKNISDHYYSLGTLKSKQNLFQKIIFKLSKKNNFKQKENKYLKSIANNEFDLIYSNSVVSINYGKRIKSYFKNSKHIIHVHELNTIIQLMCPNFKEYSKNVDHFIAASDLVKNSLIKNWEIPANLISRVYECSRTKIEEINNKSDYFYVGGAGKVNWRKGTDLFIQIANIFKVKYPNEKIKFVWLGSISKAEKIIIEEDIRKAGLKNIVEFVGEIENPSIYFNKMDLFLMTSREDPFPLVCIEVGMLGKPIICFKGATGSEEIIKKGGGVIVPYLDVNAMVEEIYSYKNDSNKLSKHGEINANEFNKFTPEYICPELFNVINKIE